MLLQNQRCLQEGALTALASVADAANAHFIRYYDTVMPMLKTVLYGANNKSEQLLRAKALECVSLVGMAVGKERFRADAQEVMAFMQQLQVRCLKPWYSVVHDIYVGIEGGSCLWDVASFH